MTCRRSDPAATWLGAVMQPIERMFVLMAVIGVVGFAATILYLTR